VGQLFICFIKVGNNTTKPKVSHYNYNLEHRPFSPLLAGSMLTCCWILKIEKNHLKHNTNDKKHWWTWTRKLLSANLLYKNQDKITKSFRIINSPLIQNAYGGKGNPFQRYAPQPNLFNSQNMDSSISVTRFFCFSGLNERLLNEAFRF